MTSGDGHSSLPASGITSAAPIVAFATAQCNARPLSRASPNLCPMMRQTMAEAWDQSPSDGSRGHAIVASESPEVGTVRKTGKSRCASRKAVATSAAISSNDCRMISRWRRDRGFYELRHCAVLHGCGGIYPSPTARVRRGCGCSARSQHALLHGQVTQPLPAAVVPLRLLMESSREDYYGCDDDCGRRSQAPCRAL